MLVIFCWRYLFRTHPSHLCICRHWRSYGIVDACDAIFLLRARVHLRTGSVCVLPVRLHASTWRYYKMCQWHSSRDHHREERGCKVGTLWQFDTIITCNLSEKFFAEFQLAEILGAEIPNSVNCESCGKFRIQFSYISLYYQRLKL